MNFNIASSARRCTGRHLCRDDARYTRVYGLFSAIGISSSTVLQQRQASSFTKRTISTSNFNHIHVRRTVSTGTKATILRRQRKARSSAGPVVKPSSGKDIGHSNRFQLGSELLDEDAIIVSIDYGYPGQQYGYPSLQRDNMSFGISSLDTRDVQSLPLGYGALNLQKKFNTRYLEVRRDQSEVLDGTFHHGAVELVTQDELLAAVREVLQLDTDNDASKPTLSRAITESKRKIVLTGWALDNESGFLRRHFDLDLTQHAHQMRIIDAQSEYGPPAVGLEVALERMRLPSFGMHNSGNDAFYAMQCLLTLMCFSGKKLSDLPTARAQPLPVPVLDFDFSPAFSTVVQAVMKELDLSRLLTSRGQQSPMPRADAEQNLSPQDITDWQLSCLGFAQRVWNHASRLRSVSEADAMLKASWDCVEVPHRASYASVKSLPLTRLLLWTCKIANEVEPTILDMNDAADLRYHNSASQKLLQPLPAVPKTPATRPSTSIAELEGSLQPLPQSLKARLGPYTQYLLCMNLREMSTALARASRFKTDAEALRIASPGYASLLKHLYDAMRTDSLPPLWNLVQKIVPPMGTSKTDPKYLENMCLRVFIYETMLKHAWPSFQVPRIYEAASAEAARLAKGKDISESKILARIEDAMVIDPGLLDHPVRGSRTVVLDQHQPTVLQATLPAQS